MTRLAELSSDEHDGVPVVAISGEIDLSNVRDISDALLHAVPAEAPGLVVDMAGVRHIDSSGLRMLFDLRRRLDQRRQELVLAVPETARIREVLDLAAVETTIVLEAEVDSAVASLRAVT